MRVWWAILLLLVAGCTEDSPGEDSGDPGDGTGDGTGDGNNTEEPGNTTNRAPTASMAANITTQAAPFLVVFTINATDADNDTVTWDLDADGDNATDVSGQGSANATFEYAAAGTYNVSLELTDGNATLRLNMTLIVDGGTTLEPLVISGEARLPCPQCREAGANTGAGYRGGQSGVDSVFATIPAEYKGASFTASASAGDIDLSFRTSCDAGAASDLHAGAGAPSGTVPDDAGCVLMWNYSESASTLTITIG